MTLNGFKKGFTGISFFILLSALMASPAGLTVLAPQEASASDIPEWVQSIKLNGDLRFRYQTQDDEDGDKRDRFRIRLRTGVKANVTDSWKVAFGLATGGDDPRSTNQTLSNFSTGDIRLDYAYGTYSASDSIDITFGKMKNPIWKTKDLMWDGDIMPGGFAAPMNFKASDSLSFFVTPAYFVLGELRESKDDEDLDNMLLLQGGINAKIAGDAYIKAAATVYSFNDIVSAYGDEYSNTEDIEGAYALDFEAGYKGAPIMVAVFGQYVSSDADEEEMGYLLGVKCGSAKVKGLGDWQVKYNFRSLELNAVPSFLPDSDAMDGDTGIEGSEVEVVVGLADNVSCGLDYYAIEEIDGDAESNVLQLDVVLKF
jgi:hypothetical protein